MRFVSWCSRVPGAGIGNLDEETVKYAADGAQGSSWFQGSDVGSPVNGTVLFVVAPESHWVRCYAAKDVRLSADKREAIENAAGSHYARGRLGRRSRGDGAAAGDIHRFRQWEQRDDAGRPVRSSPSWREAGWLAFYIWRGVTARRLGRAAHKKMMQVVYTYDLTELQAGTLPEGSRRSRDVGSDYRRFQDEYDTVSRAWKDFGEPRGAQWFGRGIRAQAARLAERTASLIELDAAVNTGAATRADTIQNPGGAAL